MTNYNDGKWHGWNGGECPVHPETVVQVVMYDRTSTSRHIDHFNGPDNNVAAKHISGCWKHADCFRHVIAFRVIKEHKVPREFWVADGWLFTSLEQANQYKRGFEMIHVKEVLE